MANFEVFRSNFSSSTNPEIGRMEWIVLFHEKKIIFLIIFFFREIEIHTIWESDIDWIGCPLTEWVLMVNPCHKVVDEMPNNLATEFSSSLPKSSTSKASSPNPGVKITLPNKRMADRTRTTSINGMPAKCEKKIGGKC